MANSSAAAADVEVDLEETLVTGEFSVLTSNNGCLPFVCRRNNVDSENFGFWDRGSANWLQWDREDQRLHLGFDDDDDDDNDIIQKLLADPTAWIRFLIPSPHMKPQNP